MIAIVRHKYGGSEVLNVREISIPKPKKDEVLVKVHYTTVNRTDCGILTGKPFLIRFFTGLFKPKSAIPGTDFAGEVVEVGKELKSFKAGDRVFGLNDEGIASQSEFMIFKEKEAIVKIPEDVSFKNAVAIAEGGHYAFNFLNKITLNKGSKVLVNGGTGAIGSAAIQFLKARGVYVVATCGTENIDKVVSLGADKVVDYQKEDFTKLFEGDFDFIFDAVGKSSFGKCKKLLKDNGVYISSELGPYAENIYLPLITKLKGGKKVVFPIPSNCKRSLDYIVELFKEGKLKPLIDEKEFKPKSIKEAYNYVASGKKIGAVLLSFEEG